MPIDNTNINGFVFVFIKYKVALFVKSSNGQHSWTRVRIFPNINIPGAKKYGKNYKNEMLTDKGFQRIKVSTNVGSIFKQSIISLKN